MGHLRGNSITKVQASLKQKWCFRKRTKRYLSAIQVYNTKASPAHQVTAITRDQVTQHVCSGILTLQNLRIYMLSTDVILLHQPELGATSQVIRSFYVYFLSEMEISQVQWVNAYSQHLGS